VSVLEIPTTASGSGLEPERRRVPNVHTIKEGNGERELAEILGPGWLYEPYEYPLPSGFSFVPDFCRRHRRRRRGRHLELTWLDMAVAREQRRLETPGLPEEEVSRLAFNLEQLTERWQRKLHKVQTAQELYGERYGDFILVTYADYLRLIDGRCSVSDLAA
jgi:hypothetical protein